MILFHGTNTTVREPKIVTSGHYKDFGFGFYCTNIEEQAQRWALTRRGKHVVCLYEYEPLEGLDVKRFGGMTEEWLDFIAECRSGIAHGHDIVDGPMADDQVWDYVEEFIAGHISREAFWALARFKRPTHQIVFCTDRSLRSLTFHSSYEL